MNRVGLLAFALTLAIGGTADGKTLRWGSGSDVATLDPYAHNETFTNNVHMHIYDALVTRDRELQIVPALALSWEQPDPLRWRFRLREGVKFHGGEDFTAADVVASVTRMLHPDSRGASNLPHIAGAEEVDKLTVDFVMKGQYPLLLNDLVNFPIMSKTWLEKNNAVEPGNIAKGKTTFASTSANGTGPFKLVSYAPDVKTVLEINKDWWKKPEHNITRVEFLPISSAATRVSALLSGELDFISPAPLQDLERIGKTTGFIVKEEPSVRLIFLGLNWRPNLLAAPNEKNPLLDVRVRRALWHAIDSETIQKRIMRGSARATGGIVAPQITGFDAELDKPFGYDSERAKALLSEAGYPNGFKVGLACSNDRFIADEQLCVAVGGMWARIGVEADVRTESRSNFFPRVDRGETDTYLYGWANLPTLDASSIISVVLSSRRTGFGGNNPNGFVNPRIDEIANAIAVELDEKKRQTLIREALTIAREEVAMIPLHFQPVAWGLSDKLDLPQFADEYIRLWFARLN